MMVSNHFFHTLKEWILEMDDPSKQSYTTYTQTDITYMAILKNVCGQHSMREMEENFTGLRKKDGHKSNPRETVQQRAYARKILAYYSGWNRSVLFQRETL